MSINVILNAMHKKCLCEYNFRELCHGLWTLVFDKCGNLVIMLHIWDIDMLHVCDNIVVRTGLCDIDMLLICGINVLYIVKIICYIL